MPTRQERRHKEKQADRARNAPKDESDEALTEKTKAAYEENNKQQRVQMKMLGTVLRKVIETSGNEKLKGACKKCLVMLQVFVAELNERKQKPSVQDMSILLGKLYKDIEKFVGENMTIDDDTDDKDGEAIEAIEAEMSSWNEFLATAKSLPQSRHRAGELEEENAGRMKEASYYNAPYTGGNMPLPVLLQRLNEALEIGY